MNFTQAAAVRPWEAQEKEAGIGGVCPYIGDAKAGSRCALYWPRPIPH